MGLFILIKFSSLIKKLISFVDKFTSLEYGAPICQHDVKNNIYYELDIYNNSNDKGTAIKILLKYLDLNRNYSMCFGDGRNDCSMFNVCKNKVAMLNGNNKLKEKADFVTEYSNEKDGVAKFIEKNLLTWFYKQKTNIFFLQCILKKKADKPITFNEK